ncbi:MAG: HipA N-terminal domain-containing protein [Polyangiaceae bacterium]|nr:HipA N-terminal domain-containing protein [Polyangiaceae bacterium]
MGKNARRHLGTARRRRIPFPFDENWLEVPNRPVLGQIFEDRIPDDIVTSGLPCWFAHLLPQGPLLRMIAREAGVEPEDDFEILRHIGEDLPGAVILMPGTNRPHRQRKPLVQTTPSGDGRLRFSALAGAQLKLSVHEGERGIVIPVEGGAGNGLPSFTIRNSMSYLHRICNNGLGQECRH